MHMRLARSPPWPGRSSTSPSRTPLIEADPPRNHSRFWVLFRGPAMLDQISSATTCAVSWHVTLIALSQPARIVQYMQGLCHFTGFTRMLETFFMDSDECFS